MDEFLRDYDVSPAEQREVEALDAFLIFSLERIIQTRVPGEPVVKVGSKGSTARGTQSRARIDFDIAVVGIDAERNEAALNVVLHDLRAELECDERFQSFAVRVFPLVPKLIIEPFRKRRTFWLGRLVAKVGDQRQELVDITVEPDGSIGLAYTSWIRNAMAAMSPEARRRATASARLLKDIMQRLGAYALRTGGIRGIVTDLLILQLGGDINMVLDALYSHMIVDTGDGEHFQVRPQTAVAQMWVVENPLRPAPHLFHNLLMILDHGEPALPLETNGWNWRVLATLAWRVHWMRQRTEAWNLQQLVCDVRTRVGPRPQLSSDSSSE